MATLDGGGLYGSLELLILKILSRSGPIHGLAIAQQIASSTDYLFQIEEGSLYPALHRLQGKGYVEWEWLISDKQRRAKFYTLSPKGRKAYQKGLNGWIRNTVAIMKVLELNWQEME